MRLPEAPGGSARPAAGRFASAIALRGTNPASSGLLVTVRWNGGPTGCRAPLRSLRRCRIHAGFVRRAHGFATATVARDPALSAGIPRFFARPLVSGAFLVGGFSTLAGNLALFARSIEANPRSSLATLSSSRRLVNLPGRLLKWRRTSGEPNVVQPRCHARKCSDCWKCLRAVQTYR